MSIDDANEWFEILIQVSEAKSITQTSEMAETKDALQQARDTVTRLNRIFVENDDAISRAAWCKRLVELLVNRDGLSEHLPDPRRRTAFLDGLCDRKWHAGHDAENAEVSKPSTTPAAPDTEVPSSSIAPIPMVSPPSLTDGKLAEPSVVTIESIAKPLSKSPDVASFFPVPFGTVLTNMAARETRSIDDPASVE